MDFPQEGQGIDPKTSSEFTLLILHSTLKQAFSGVSALSIGASGP